MERSGVLPTTQFAYWKGLGTCDALLCVSHTLQSALESGQEARILQIEFIAALDRLPMQMIFDSLCKWYVTTYANDMWLPIQILVQLF